MSQQVAVSAEICTINLVFKEERIRGTEHFKCVVIAEDADAPDQDISDRVEASSWDVMRKTYPNLKDLVEHMFWSDRWQVCGYGHDDRYLVLDDCIGVEGIYDYTKGDDIRVLWSEIKDNSIIFPDE